MTKASMNMTTISSTSSLARKMVGCKTLATCALSLVVLTGCAALAPATPETAVMSRAQQRWKALVANDWVGVHAFLTPAFRATMPADRYKERFIGVPKWKNVTIKSANCEPEKCTVVVRIEAEYGARTGMQTLSTDVPETWLKEDGQWYKYESM